MPQRVCRIFVSQYGKWSLRGNVAGPVHAETCPVVDILKGD